ncbi:MAG: DUF1616 domain-containing protein [Nanoarchaeota archaeon]|nr:DUF1616 domain-containing protein [Nanoarchaeota archaeon]
MKMKKKIKKTTKKPAKKKVIKKPKKKTSKKPENNKYIKGIIISILALIIISAAIGFFSNLTYLESFRIIFGSVYVLFLPGFIFTYVFFPKTREFETKEKGSIDWIERIALSFALSIAVVPLIIFYLNLTGIPINTLNSFLTILGIIIILTIIKIKRNPFR